jgi:hypothetical protein
MLILHRPAARETAQAFEVRCYALHKTSNCLLRMYVQASSAWGTVRNCYSVQQPCQRDQTTAHHCLDLVQLQTMPQSRPIVKSSCYRLANPRTWPSVRGGVREPWQPRGRGRPRGRGDGPATSTVTDVAVVDELHINVDGFVYYEFGLNRHNESSDQIHGLPSYPRKTRQ